ncbi:tripartite tricarboxylate transporter substrate binding protein [Variovorax terrae]|uniref:Tripartite tricarboxylate transporter substrate binding protein n=1 Tax=Variovorax terrae TaxID=2923278 RepID=A0A9X1VXS8_9BURK|nr:tripartite tricarboxylate transporter substrate binding protein [Variovorax terrae]MCJ0764129.1 tripartite tricarboxylate transporter substrate binding protein [Variovorax terrae]
MNTMTSGAQAPFFRRTFVLSMLALSHAAAAPAWAQEAWPSKPVKVVVPFAAGGGSDIIARFVATKLGAALGQPFVIDNRPGAGGNLGTEQGAKAAPDGYTLTLIASSYSVNPSVYKLGFDPIQDITPIVQISGGPLIIVANPQTPIKTVRDLVQEARKRPGQLNYATSGAGGIAHAATELLLDQADIKMTHIPYKGTAPALNDTIAGTTDIYFSSVTSALPQIKAGKLRAIAVTASTRLKVLPEVPTVAESGLPGYDVPHWHALIGPKGMPPAVVAKLNQTVNAFLKQPDADEHLQRDGVSAVGGTPAQLNDRIVREIGRWKKLAAAGNFKVE